MAEVNEPKIEQDTVVELAIAANTVISPLYDAEAVPLELTALTI